MTEQVRSVCHKGRQVGPVSQGWEDGTRLVRQAGGQDEAGPVSEKLGPAACRNGLERVFFYSHVAGRRGKNRKKFCIIVFKVGENVSGKYLKRIDS